MLPLRVHENINEFFESACLEWKQMSSRVHLPENPIYQSSWDKPLYEHIQQNLLTSASSDKEIARLLAVSSQCASDWLYAIPIPALGLKLDPMSLKVSCAVRLGSPLCHPHVCICGAMVESDGLHGLTCKKQIGRRSRHNQINDIIRRALIQSKIHAIN